MLDPVTAIGLTAAIVQLIGNGTSFLSKCREIFASRATAEQIDLELVVSDLESVSEDIKQSLSAAGANETNQLGRDDRALVTLASNCQALARQLLNKVRSLQISGQNGRWKSFRQAIKATWAQNEVDSLMKRIDRFRDQLQFQILAHVRSQINLSEVHQGERFQQLDRRSQDIIRLISTNRDLFGLFLTDLHGEAEVNASRRHGESRQWQRRQEKLAEQRHAEIIAAINQKQRKKDSDVIERKVLAHLRFGEMLDRREEVAEAYQETFEWIFDKDFSPEETPWSNLLTWLENDSGCYWIGGKAGSGKSTLMKFIEDHDRTYEALLEWSSRIHSGRILEPWALHNGLIITSFFFWNAGTYLQISQLGLLRKVLYDILKQCPAIIPVVLPQLYEEIALTDRTLIELSFSRCKQALTRLIKYRTSQFGLCLFVDGLDEYIADQGSHTELADFFLSLSHSPKIKIIVSSRPLTAFEDAFHNCPKLRLQDLTRGDIEFYVHDRLNKYRRIVYLIDEDPRAAEDLLQEIITKAAGVFLWVKLAVNTLLEG